MFSYLKRLKSFKDWNEKDRELIKKLSVMGQYSVDAKLKKTACYYCNTTHSKWNVNDIPFHVHYTENENCPLFRISSLNGRKELSVKKPIGKSSKSYIKELSKEATNLCEKNYVQFNIDNKDLFFCAICGTTDNEHSCEKKVQKYKEYTDSESAQFYIKYLHGLFIPLIDEYLNYKVNITDDAKATLKYCLNNEIKCSDFIRFEDFLAICSERLFSEIEKKMKQIEKDEIDSMYTESMIL